MMISLSLAASQERVQSVAIDRQTKTTPRWSKILAWILAWTNYAERILSVLALEESVEHIIIECLLWLSLSRNHWQQGGRWRGLHTNTSKQCTACLLGTFLIYVWSMWMLIANFCRLYIWSRLSYPQFDVSVLHMLDIKLQPFRSFYCFCTL
jgi:hypothetical protein